MIDARSSTYVYVVAEIGTTRPCKVGVSEDVRQRLSGMQCGNPRELVICSFFLVDSREAALRAESLALKRFRVLRGEWVDAEVDAVADFLSAATAATCLETTHEMEANEDDGGQAEPVTFY